ncbi:unnamed protein product [[Candida] boidinii]|nr:unnamed protein product [[Candida] boidinii]
MSYTIRHDQEILKDNLNSKSSTETSKNDLISEILLVRKELLKLQDQHKEDTNTAENLHNKANGAELQQQGNEIDIDFDSEEVYEDEEDSEINEIDMAQELDEDEGMLNYETYTQSVKLYEMYV